MITFLALYEYMLKIHFNFFSIWFYVNTWCVYVKLIVDCCYSLCITVPKLDASENIVVIVVKNCWGGSKTYEDCVTFIFGGGRVGGGVVGGGGRVGGGRVGGGGGRDVGGVVGS